MSQPICKDLRNMQNQGQNLQSQMANLTDMLSKFVTANTASTSGSGTLPAVILNKLPKKLGDPGRFLIPCEFTGITTCNALADLGASINLMPYSVWNNLSLPELTPTCMTLELADRSITKPIGLDEYSQESLGISNVIASGIHSMILSLLFLLLSPNLTPFGDSDFLLFEEADSFLALEDDPTSSEVDPTYQDPEGDILLLEAILNSKPPPSLPNQEQYLPGVRKELKLCEDKTVESFVDEPPEVELKELPPHLEYEFLEGDDKLPSIMQRHKDGGKGQLFSRSQSTSEPSLGNSPI
ncbi:reverse transcriptase domain-containing protein [Tanacetum coccineum]|uniref:Reverse transcriptase domain-containing protein n=1 Tax=Tanacetum coccineum TaxID=301880 RepID=A0ABQ5CB40_9ASTR